MRNHGTPGPGPGVDDGKEVMAMFSLMPWKRRSSNIKVRRDEPLSDFDRDFYPLARLRDELDAMMDRFFEPGWMSQRLFADLPGSWGWPRWDWTSDLGWEDQENEYVLRAELPGFEAEDFDVKVSGNVLTVRAEHKHEGKEKNGGRQYRYGSFYRTVTLPQGVDESQIEARYHSGVLEVHLPKTEQARGKRIEVQTA